VKTRLIMLSLLAAANLAHADLAEKISNRKPNRYQPDTAWQEQALPLPGYPVTAQWVELDAPVTVKPRIFIDSSSLVLAEDRTVRFALRQLSSSGIDNISLEGMHCGERTQRSFAFADTVGKRWIASSRVEWRRLDGNSALQQTVIKALCPEDAPPLNAEELANNLKQAAKRR